MAIREIEVDELASLIERAAGSGRELHLVDVREPDEYAEGHVPGAVSVPLATVPERLDAFEGAETTYVICKTGGRSLRACEFAAAHGADVVNVAGGTMAWIVSGRAVESGGR